jgi:hypothetical protein
MRYRVVLTTIVRDFLNGLHDDDKQAVRVLIDAIGESPEGGDIVWSTDDEFYQKTYDLDKRRWPNGLRIVYKYWEDKLLVALVDVGDHHTSASHPGQSIYPDER